MLTLEKIFRTSDHGNRVWVTRDIVIEDRLWCVYKKQPAQCDHVYQLIHRCSVNAKAIDARVNKIVCGYCSETAPSGLVLILKFMRLERDKKKGCRVC